MSQPAREYVVKIIELSLWSSDLLLGHLLLFMLSPPVLVPYMDRFHATMLCESVRVVHVTITNSLCSLAATVETNSSTSLLSKANQATSLDCERYVFLIVEFH